MSNTDSTSDDNSWKSRLGFKNKKPKSSDTPIRIIHIPFLNLLPYESKAQYRRRLCMYSWNGLCHVCLGAVNMSVIIYAVLYKDTHAALCCFGVRLIFLPTDFVCISTNI